MSDVSYVFVLSDERKVPPDWVCGALNCDEALPYNLWETRTDELPPCPRCKGLMMRSPYAVAIARSESPVSSGEPNRGGER